MTLSCDLARLVRSQFDRDGIFYSPSLNLDHLAAHYFEMMIRQIQPRLAALTTENCISRRPCRIGLAVVKKTTRSPIVTHDSALA